MEWIDSGPMKTVRSVIMVLVSGYCLVLASTSNKLIRPALQQMSPETLHEQTSELGRRINALEAMNLEHRLTMVEGEIDAMSLQTRGTMGGVGVLLIEGVLWLTKKKQQDANG